LLKSLTTFPNTTNLVTIDKKEGYFKGAFNMYLIIGIGFIFRIFYF